MSHIAQDNYSFIKMFRLSFIELHTRINDLTLEPTECPQEINLQNMDPVTIIFIVQHI